MKKILLATTLIVATASVAAAEVAVSGSARMGIVSVPRVNASAGYAAAAAAQAAAAAAYKAAPGVGTLSALNFRNDALKAETAAVKSGTAFSSRVRIGFAGSGTTDGGLTFGAAMRADQNGGNADGTANGDSTVFLSGSFGTLTMGDVAGGASDNLVGQVSGIGYTGLGDRNEIGFNGGTATAARYDYTMGAFSVSVGLGQPTAADKAKSVAVKYAAGNYSVALGYSDTDTNSQIDALGSVTFGAATVKVRAAQRDKVAAGEDKMAYAASLDYAFSGITLTGFYGNNTDFGAVVKGGRDTYGVGASYDLGGGAALSAGYADNGTANNSGVFEAGVTLSF